MKRLIAFLALIGVALAAPSTPINNANIQLNGVSQTGVLAGNTTGAATATQAQISAALDLLGATQGNVLYRNGTVWTVLAPGTSGQVLTSGGASANPSWTTDAGGSVTSVGLSMPDIFTVTNSPVTTTGTLTATLVNQTANYVWAGPASGPAAPPTFRALVAADLPSGAYVSSITGTANQITASASTGAVTLSLAGPHAFTSLTANALLLGNGTSAITASDLTYVSPTLNVPAGFTLNGAGSIALASGGTNSAVTIRSKGTAAVSIGSNATGMPSAPSGFGWQLGPYGVIDNIGDAGFITFRRTNGSAASPTATLNGNSLLYVEAKGYKATAYSGAAGAISINATQDWTDSATGTEIQFSVTPNGSAASGNRMFLTNAGNLVVGSSNSETGLTGAGGVKITSTTSASSSTAGAVVIGNGTAATNVALGGGNINAGGTVTAASGLILSDTGASATKGLNFSTDMEFYRSANNQVTLAQTADADAFLSFVTGASSRNAGFRFGTTSGGTQGGFFAANTTSGLFEVSATGTLRLSSSAATSLQITGGANATLTGGAGNMTITAGTGASRTLTLQTTTSGGTATNAVVFGATQSATFNGPIIQKVSALTYASPTSVDVTLGNVYTVTTVNATGSVTFNATAGGTSGQELTFIITNDATSAKTITFGTNFVANGTLTASGASKVTTIKFMSNGTNFYETARTVLP